jgi:hypothetical protein
VDLARVVGELDNRLAGRVSPADDNDILIRALLSLDMGRRVIQALTLEPIRILGRLEDFHFEDTRFLDAGTDRVVILYRIVGRGAGSGVPVSRDVGALWQLRNGKLLKGEVYLDQREALEAAGLPE